MIVSTIPGLQLFDTAKIPSITSYPIAPNDPIMNSRIEDKKGYFYIEGDGFYGDVEVLQYKVNGGPVERRIRLDGQKGITPVRGSVDGLYFFQLYNASTGLRYPKLYKWMAEIHY